MSITNIDDLYTIGRILGTGGFSVVHLATRNKDNLQVAVKILSKSDDVSVDEMNIVQNELNILDMLEHPNILELIDVFQSPESVYIVLELLPRGELFDLVVSSETNFLDENVSATCLYDILKGLEYLHEIRICHRDIKLENVLITADGHCKIVDFGTAVEFAGFDEMDDTTGTPLYQSPEVLKCESFSFNTDIWSTGITLFMMLSGCPPYADDEDPLIGIIKEDYKNYPSEFDFISVEGMNILESMLERNRKKRSGAAALLKHEWFNIYRRESILYYLEKDD